MVNTLADALPAKINEMNNVIIPAYVACIPFSPPTMLMVNYMRDQVAEAVSALASGDVVRMIRAYAAIKDYTE